jgi:hypothetical protein
MAVLRMIKPAGRTVDVTRYGSDGSGSIGAIAALALGWMLAFGGVIGTMLAVPRLGWDRASWVAVLLASLPYAMWMTRRVAASRRLREIVPPLLLERRCHGNLESITDSEQRPLRSIGSSARDAAIRTGVLLSDPVAVPGVRIFHGVRPPGASLPLISHAISAGRELLLVESVAWPPGHYETAANGQVHCNGTYIGQSAHLLIRTVHLWRELLPKNHRVSAMVVVHAAADDIVLPAASAEDLTWVLAADALADIRRRIKPGSQPASRNVVAALIAPAYQADR